MKHCLRTTTFGRSVKLLIHYTLFKTIFHGLLFYSWVRVLDNKTANVLVQIFLVCCYCLSRLLVRTRA
jgi:hypothetical protein